MAHYVLRIGNAPYAEREIDANCDAEVFGYALTAVAEFVRSSFPPPPKIEMTVMDALKNRIGVLKLSCDLA
jgi:hypothetical protein